MSIKSKKQTNVSGSKKFVAAFIFTFAIASVVTQTGCSSGKAAAVEPPATNQLVSKEKVIETEKKQPAVFYKIALLGDRSGSVESTRTPPLTMEQLDALIAFVQEKSGEIAFGFIDEDSNKPFLRLRIESRPVPPMPPETKNNPFEQEKLFNEYRVKMTAFQGLERKWKTATADRIAEFKTGAQTMLDCLSNKKCRSNSTDVIEAVKRADLFLSEDEKVPPTGVLLLITDGQETTKPKAAAPTIRSQPLILVVNGSASLGILKSYQPEPFEGIDAAIRRLARIQPSAEPSLTQVSSPTAGNKVQAK